MKVLYPNSHRVIKTYAQIAVVVAVSSLISMALTATVMSAKADDTIASQCVRDTSQYHDLISMTKLDIEKNIEAFREGLYQDLELIQDTMHKDNKDRKQKMGL